MNIRTSEIMKAYENFKRVPKNCNTEEWEIYLKKREKLEKAIKEAEGRATARTITVSDIMESLRYIEKKLGVPKKALEGCKIYVDINAQDFPKAYKYIPESTHFSAEFVHGSWRITNISRGQIRKPSKRYLVDLTEDAKKAILGEYEEFF